MKGILQLNRTSSGSIVNGVTMAGGTIQNMANNASTMGSLTLTANSTINLLSGGTTAGQLKFSNTTWTPGTSTLTINNWTGNPESSGTANQIYFASGSALIHTTLSGIQFTGFGAGAYVLGSGEIVPAPEPGTYWSSLLLLGLISGHLVKRRKPLVVP